MKQSVYTCDECGTTLTGPVIIAHPEDEHVPFVPATRHVCRTCYQRIMIRELKVLNPLE